MVKAVHRGGRGRTFAEMPIHAAEGVHEHALSLIASRIPRGSSILDVGTGSGALAARLAAAGYDVTASDFDLDDYKAAVRAVEWDVVDVNVPPSLARQGYDAVCAIELLEHVENPLQALRNLRSLIRPGGCLVVSTPNITHPKSRIKFLLRGAPSYFGSPEYDELGHRTLLPDWLLIRHLNEAGLVDAELSYAGAFGLSGSRRVAYGGLRLLLRALNLMPSPIQGDGAVTFVVAKPAP